MACQAIYNAIFGWRVCLVVLHHEECSLGTLAAILYFLVLQQGLLYCFKVFHDFSAFSSVKSSLEFGLLGACGFSFGTGFREGAKVTLTLFKEVVNSLLKFDFHGVALENDDSLRVEKSNVGNTIRS